MQERRVDVAILGSGSAGLYALGRVRQAGKSFVLINGGDTGTTCARVGCMPSKAMIQVAEDYHRRAIFERYGIEGQEALTLDSEEMLEHVRDLRDTFVERVLSNSTDKMSDEHFIAGYARFVEPNLLEVNGQMIRADNIVIATGSTPIIPAAWEEFGDRIITTDDIFELEELPQSLAVIGLGAIGLELGQSIARMGVEVSGFDILDTIAGISDPEVAQMAIKSIGRELPLHLGAAAEISREGDKLRVTAGEQSVVVERVLASLGRRPNLQELSLENSGLELDTRGIPLFNSNTMQCGNSRIFIAGDVDGERQLLHEAGDEGRIAGHNACQETAEPFRRKTPIGIVFCDPNIAAVGTRWSELDPATTAVGKVDFAPVGRALIMGKNRGTIRIYADKVSGRLLGAEMFCARAEHLAHLLAWSIQQEMSVGQMLQMPFYHPVLEEAMQAALYACYEAVETKNAGPITELQQL